jgi:hypothetical protein
MALAHCVALDFNMGKGVALQFKQRFGGVQELRSQELQVGSVGYIVRKGRNIYYAITKNKSDQLPTWDDFVRAITALRDQCIKDKVKSLGIPKIGCGEDKFLWEHVCPLLGDIFARSGIEVVVFLNECVKVVVLGDASLRGVESSDHVDIRYDNNMVSTPESIKCMIQQSRVQADYKMVILYLGDCVSRAALDNSGGKIYSNLCTIIKKFRSRLQDKNLMVVGAVRNATLGDKFISNINRDIRAACKQTDLPFIDPRGWPTGYAEMEGEVGWSKLLSKEELGWQLRNFFLTLATRQN